MDKSEIPEAAVRNPACEQSQSQCFKCPLCPKSFSRIKVLRLHISSHTKEKPYKCEHCDFSTACEHRHQRHIERNHDRSMWETRLKYKCELCTHKFLVPAGLRLHMLTHSEDREYFPCNVSGCDIFHHCSHGHCAYKTRNQNQLKIHRMRHHGNKSFKCTHSKCRYRAVTERGLAIHLASHLTKQAHKCGFPNCSYQNREKHRLLRHMKTHSQVRPFPCTVQGCKFRAKTEDVLRAHKGTHNKEATLPCTFPGWAYLARNRSRLNNHVMRHRKYPNPRACPQPGCNHFANDSKSLRKHQQIHNSGRTFACPFCPKFFKSQTSLDRQSFCHTKERPIRCVYCDYGTYVRQSLTQHYEKIHSGENLSPGWPKPTLITCKYCPFSGTPDAISKHNATGHTILIVNVEKIKIKYE